MLMLNMGRRLVMLSGRPKMKGFHSVFRFRFVQISNWKEKGKSKSGEGRAMRSFYNEVRALKVKDLPARLKPIFTIDSLKNAGKRGLDSYHAKYIETNSIDPLYHICFGGMALSYLVALPEERRHLEHQQKHGGGH